MRIYFKDDDTLVVGAQDSIEAMALKYWLSEFEKQGSKLLEVDTDAPIQLSSPTPN
jgi:hypothetical protein